MLDIYQWGSATLPVVYANEAARDALLGRMAKIHPVGKRVLRATFPELRKRYPSALALFDGWECNLKRSPAMLALGLAACIGHHPGRLD